MKRLAVLRENLEKSQREVAEDLMISKSSYGNYELGNREADYTTLKQLATYFNVTVDYLLEIDSVKPFKLPNQITNYAEAISFLKDLNLLPNTINQPQHKVIMFAQMLYLGIRNFKW